MIEEITAEKLAGMIDHTNLKAYSPIRDIKQLCDEALKYNFHSVCVNPSYVGDAASFLLNSDVRVCSVVGFPLGANHSHTKISEAINATNEGASEIDMVMDIGAFKNKEYDSVENEIKAVNYSVKAHMSDSVVKVIIETCYLSSEEIKEACKIVSDSGADYIKTSTGFGKEGATVENILLMKETIDSLDSRLKIKAAGGIKQLEDALNMIQAGADRLGTSSSTYIIDCFNGTAKFGPLKLKEY